MNSSPQSRPLKTACLFIILFTVLSSLGVLFLVRHENKRDQKDWQIFLEATTNSKQRLVDNWLSAQLFVVSELSQNASLQHYTREARRPGVSPGIKESQLTFLRSLIHTTADKNSFSDSNASYKPKANIQRKSPNGLAILSSDLEYIIGTTGFDYSPELLRQSMNHPSSVSKPRITKVSKGSDGLPVVGFIAPLINQKTTQTDSGKVSGVIYGYKSLAPLLAQLSATSTKYSSEETLLLFEEQKAIVNITPLADGTQPLMMKRPANAPTASAYALKSPGTFNRLTDYQGNDVFFVSTAIKETDWILIHKIDTSQALTESKDHQRFLIISLGLATFLISSLLAASWWYVNSIKKQALAKDLHRQNTLLAVKNHLLDSINDTIRDFILLVDSHRHCIFMSTQFAHKLSCSPKDIEGRTVESVLGIDQAIILEEYIASAFSQKNTITTPLLMKISGAVSYLHATFTPLHFEKAVGEYDATLITFHDLTALKAAEDRENNLQRQLIKTLMSAIDKHDPYSANHSAKTAAISLLVGKAMNISSPEIETLQSAASLCNLGKLSIEKGLLTKATKLTDDELRAIRIETQYACDLLTDIDFEGPVTETIAQKYEHLDGSGYPHGLKGAAIIPTARILGAVNAFVAMISPRAYRDRLSPQKSIELLMASADTIYDRKVLAALFQVVENEIDWDNWNV
nr:PAS domain-containing protein [Desulfobulbaceae bacterium]